MIAGSYLFAELSGWISRMVDPIGDRGKLTLFDLLPINRTLVVLGSLTLLIVVLIAIETFAAR